MRTRIENNNLESLAALKKREYLFIQRGICLLDHTHTHTGIFIKMNKFVQKISIMLFSNVLFLCTMKNVQEVTYC